MPDEPWDVAIVGAGVSGVYAAWRLLTAGGRGRVVVLEASDRVGGRLLSVPPPGIPSMVAELGGMRILPAVQPRIRELLEVLNRDESGGDAIRTYPFPVDQPRNIAYLRGRYLRLADFSEHPERVPYRLTFQEDGKVAGEIVLNAVEQIVPGITDPGLNEYDRRKLAQGAAFDGMPLYRQGFWQVLSRVMSGEAFQLAVAAGGYQSTLSNWNAADAIPWYLSDFGVDPDYRGFSQGFQQVPLALADRVRAAGGEIRFGASVVGFEQDGSAVVVRTGRGDPVRTRALILAMPRRALELIAPGSPLLLRADVSALVRSVTPRPLFKLFTTYDKPWWLPAGVEAGRSTTDLPLRQTYYWPENDGSAARSGSAMLMASYDDGINIGYWDGYRTKRGLGLRGEGSDTGGQARAVGAEAAAVPKLFVGAADAGEDAHREWRRYRPTAAMVAEVQRQLALVHGLAYVPEVRDAAFKDWGDDPYGGGWNSWNIGVQSSEVVPRIVQPVPDAPVYICGEAYSDAQGWVEGALQTADLVLSRLGVAPLVEAST